MSSTPVRLQPVELGHAPSILTWLQDPHIARNLGLASTPSLAKTRAFIRTAAGGTAVCARAIYAGDEHVGMVVLDQIDRRVQKARLHIYLGAGAARGQGTGTRALALVLCLGFEELGLHKVWLSVHARNAAAIGAYVRNGFQIEGVLRDEFLLDGERLNEIRMGILASDWRPRRSRKPKPGKRGV